MSDPLRAFAARQGLGRIERLVRLRGNAALCLTGDGLYLLSAQSEASGTVTDLLARNDVRYRVGRLSDTLRVGEQEQGIPAGKGEAAKLAIALGRLRRSAGRGPVDEILARHIEAPSELERAWLAGFLGEHEVLLAWLETATERKLPSPVAGELEHEARFVLTSERAALVVLGDAGDARVTPLEGPLTVAPGLGRAEVTMGVEAWLTTLGNAGLYTELAPAAGLARADRQLEVARLNWLGRDGKGALAYARKLLELSARADDPRALALSFLVSAELGEPEAARPDPTTAFPALRAAPVTALAELWVGWEMGTAAGRALLARLEPRGKEVEPWALELHASVHARLDEADGEERARADIELAGHMIVAGERERARSILEARLASLPSEALEDLLPAGDADLTTGAGGQTLRIRAHELLAEARGGKDERTLAELARLQPLVVARIAALAEVAQGDLAARARDVLAVLERGGLVAERERPTAEPEKALTDDLLFGLVRHPLAREGGALLGKLQTLLAAVPIPDPAVLRDYVEKLSADQQSAAAEALGQAARLFGLRKLGAYVSRGKKGIGLRSYEGPEPFVLVGGRHLEIAGPFGMTPGELRFALAAEIAHLRFGHSRVTSSEVWAGAIEKGKQGLDLALGVLPLLRGLKLARQINEVVQRVPMGALQRVASSANKLRRGVQKKLAPRGAEPPPASAEVLSALNEEVVAAHRVMQLTADRAGLLLARDLTASLRAMMLVRADYQEELEVAEKEGIDVVLARRTADGKMVHQDLAVRVAALLSFYLSNDWVRLRDAIGKRAE